jgi:lysyl-tRNA synthetase class 2
MDAVRSFFRDRGFLEVSTAAIVRCPGMEPHLRAFGLRDEKDRWLRTSPELALKRLLGAGMERIFEVARVFRAAEAGDWHLAEFDLLEWYRAYADLEAIAVDCEALLASLALAAGEDPRVAVSGVDLRPPFERVTVREAVEGRTGLDLAELSEAASLREAVRRRGHHALGDEDWDTVFFRLWTSEIEPHLGRGRPTLVFDYPASQCALARVRADEVWPVAERFELYVGGVELANAFHELNEPQEQRRRHLAEREARRRAGSEVYPLDEDFLGALEAGMPPAAGIAFGVDRLVALLAGCGRVAEVTAYG